MNCYVRAMSIYPNYAAAHYNTGVLCFDLQRIDEAYIYYHQAIVLDPLCVEAYCNLGFIEKGRNFVEKSIEYYRRALVVNPNYALAQYNLCIALNDLGTEMKDKGDIKVSYFYIVVDEGEA